MELLNVSGCWSLIKAMWWWWNRQFPNEGNASCLCLLIRDRKTTGLHLLTVRDTWSEVNMALSSLAPPLSSSVTMTLFLFPLFQTANYTFRGSQFYSQELHTFFNGPNSHLTQFFLLPINLAWTQPVMMFSSYCQKTNHFTVRVRTLQNNYRIVTVQLDEWTNQEKKILVEYIYFVDSITGVAKWTVY